MEIKHKEAETIQKAIEAARTIQDFFWGETDGRWGLAVWLRMLQKRLDKIAMIDVHAPNALVELRKRLMQNAALSIALLHALTFKDQKEIQQKLESGVAWVSGEVDFTEVQIKRASQEPRIQLAVLELVESLGWCVCGKMEDYDNWERKDKDTVIKMLIKKGRE